MEQCWVLLVRTWGYTLVPREALEQLRALTGSTAARVSVRVAVSVRFVFAPRANGWTV